jgi:hypothetical protein
LGFGFGYKNFWVLGLGIKTNTQTQKPIFGSPANSGVGLQSGNKLSQNTIKNTPEDDLDTFCNIISRLTSKYFTSNYFLNKGQTN